MNDKIEQPTRIGTQGWVQFLSAKKEIIGRFDRAKEYAHAHEVEIYHGIVAEEEFRNWLSEFLPKKFGVTSGYIVSQGLGDDVKTPHFDVIIYDALNAPVLWVEDHSGLSMSGRSRAIPAEHVLAVYEVKSQLTSGTVNKALEHLRDLAPLYESVDPPGERYRKFLPVGFSCGLVFFELLRASEFSIAALNNTVKEPIPKGYVGGVILRGEGLPDESCALINVIVGDKKMNSTVGKKKESLLDGSPLSDSVQVGNRYVSAILMWSEANFAMFAFNLLAQLNGHYEPRMLSSFHGMSWMNPKREKGDEVGN